MIGLYVEFMLHLKKNLVGKKIDRIDKKIIKLKISLSIT
jgi:hypothetical protein